MRLRGRSGRAGQRVRLIDCERHPIADEAGGLLRIVSEALILQDEAEAVLTAVSHHEHLGIVARRGGPVGRRFFALQEALPVRYDDPRLDRLRSDVHTILFHHGVQVATALEFLAVDGRSDALRQRVSDWGDLGAPARMLEVIYRELTGMRRTVERGQGIPTR